jgi:hypothetical protein
MTDMDSPEGVLPIGVSMAILFLCTISFSFCLVFHLISQGKKHDDKMKALLEFYQPIFLQTFGVELGSCVFDGENPHKGFYFRRPRQPAAPVAEVDNELPILSPRAHDDECDDETDVLRKEEECLLPAIYIHRLIPGEIFVEDKDDDAASMKGVDPETWALLQSTHATMIPCHRMMIRLTLVSCLSFCLGIFFLVLHAKGASSAWNVAGLLLMCVVPFFSFVFFFPYLDYYHNPRAYKKVTTRVNEALLQQQQQQQQQQDEDGTAHFLSLEFHDSEVPGREGILGRRYQFVVRRQRQDEEGAMKEMV